MNEEDDDIQISEQAMLAFRLRTVLQDFEALSKAIDEAQQWNKFWDEDTQGRLRRLNEAFALTRTLLTGVCEEVGILQASLNDFESLSVEFHAKRSELLSLKTAADSEQSFLLIEGLTNYLKLTSAKALWIHTHLNDKLSFIERQLDKLSKRFAGHGTAVFFMLLSIEGWSYHAWNKGDYNSGHNYNWLRTQFTDFDGRCRSTKELLAQLRTKFLDLYDPELQSLQKKAESISLLEP